jgi:holin-like protein
MLLDSFTLLLLAQLIGEFAVRAVSVPIPGPVLGGALLAGFLAWRGISPAMHETSQTLLRHLSLMFVPAGVGVIREAAVLVDYWLALSVALIISTAATMAVTALVFDWANRRFGPTEQPR